MQQQLLHVLDDVRVACAASAHKNLADPVQVNIIARQERLVLPNDILRGNARHRGKSVVLAAAGCLASVNDLLALVVAKDLPAGRLGKVVVDVLVRREEVVYDLLVDSALGSLLAVLVILLLSVSVVPYGGIDEMFPGLQS